MQRIKYIPFYEVKLGYPFFSYWRKIIKYLGNIRHIRIHANVHVNILIRKWISQGGVAFDGETVYMVALPLLLLFLSLYVKKAFLDGT